MGHGNAQVVRVRQRGCTCADLGNSDDISAEEDPLDAVHRENALGDRERERGCRVWWCDGWCELYYGQCIMDSEVWVVQYGQCSAVVPWPVETSAPLWRQPSGSTCPSRRTQAEPVHEGAGECVIVEVGD